MNPFRMLWHHMKGMKHYFIAITLVFAAGLLFGFQSEEMRNYLNSQIQGIASIAQNLGEKENPQLWFFIFIFLNNAIKAMLFVLLGAFFGIMPIFSVLLNGMVLGYIMALTAEQGHSVTEMIVKGILPHGIIEISAILIASAYGVKFGAVVLKSIVGMFRKTGGNGGESELRQFIRLIGPLTVVIISALLIAAVIESTFTFWLVQQ